MNTPTAWTILLSMSVARLSAEAGPARSYSQPIKNGWDLIKRYVAGSATAMPEESYLFRPTPEVRTFGQILGHIANSHYGNLVTYLRMKGIVPPSLARP